VTLQQQLNQAKLAKKGSAMKWVAIGAGVIVVAVGAWLGYPYLHDWMAKRSETAKQATAPQPPTNAAPAEPAPPPPPKELPLLPAVWTLDVDQAKIPEGRANGSISGTNFVVEFARLDQVGTAYLLRLLQGPPASPDMGFMIYLHPHEPGQGVPGHTWTISPDKKGKNVPQIVKLLKTNPRYQAQQKNIFSGYAMKLELSHVTNGVISGKIFLAVPPDTEQSVVAGLFQANTTLTDAPGVAANPAVAPNAPPAAANPAFQKRYRKNP
jgi:hypothetical protein